MFDFSNLKKIPRLAAKMDKAALADGAISKKHKE